MTTKLIIPNTRSYTPVPLTESVQDLPPTQSYRAVWQRSLRKIKYSRILQNYKKITSNPVENEVPDYYDKDFHRFLFSPRVKTPIPLTLFVPYNNLYIFWALLNFVSLFYISTYGQFNTSFYGYKPNSIESTFEFIIDIIFVLDVALHFNLAYFDHDNKLIVDRRKIFWNYIKSRFFLDCFTSFPFGFFIRNLEEPNIPRRYLFRHIPKFIRWVGLRRRLKYLYFIKDFERLALKYKHAYELIALSLLVMMGLHIIACIFFLSARYENFNSETWVMKCNILDFEVFEQYLSSIYWAFMTLSSIGYGDIHPFTTVEYQIAMVWMVVGVFFWSYTSSRFYITLSNIINADIMIKQNLDFAHDFSQVTFLPSVLKKRFKSCIKSKRIIIKKISIDRIIDPHDLELRYSVAMDIYNKALTKIKFFQGKGETFIAHFAFKLHFHQFHVDEILWVKKSFSDGIYFISEGRFKVTYDGLMFMIFKAGDYLGDIEIFMRSERKFDCSSCEIGRCFKMDLATLKELKIDYPIYYQELKSNFDNRMKHAMNELSMMYALRLYYTKEISSFNHDVREEIKRRMYYKMFSENFYAMRNNKILDVMHLSKELSQSVKRTSNIIKLLINMNKKEKVKH